MRLRGQILLLYLLLCLQTASNYAQWHKNGGGIGLEEVRCPSVYTLGTGPGSCVCQAASDGLDFSCESEVPPGTSLEQVRAVVSAAKFAIKSLVVSMLDSNRTMLPDKTFANGSISQITIKASNLTDVADDAFEGTHQRLHTLAIHNSLNLKNVPRAVSKVAALKRLDLSQNSIEDIYAYTFFGSAKLSYLNLEGNRLTTLAENAFLGLENNLRELNLKDNSFDTFPLSAVKILKKLQSLNLAGNRIANLSAEAFTRLESIRLLDLNDNSFLYLTKETLSCLPSLQRLWLANNGLEDIEVGSLSGLHDLQTIDLSGNSLTDLPSDIFAHTRRLTKVDLSRNSLKSLVGVFRDLFELEEVFLNDNLLLSFTNEWFSNTPNVKTIHLEHNVLIEVEENAMQPLKRLSQLFLSHNFLNTVEDTYFRYNVALTSLHLDNNHISSIDETAFRGVPKLRTLRLDKNNLRSIGRSLFATLTSLTELHLQDNKLTEIEPQAFSSLANLAHLDVTGNRMVKLEDIMMRYPSNLKALYLDKNRLQNFHRETFSGQTTLDVLSMMDNKLEKIPAGVFEELINLFRLSLANNKISVIEDNALTGLHRVRFLDLSNNRLTRLTNLTIRGLEQAEVIDLSNNRIASILPEAFFGFHHIRELDLSFNRLRTIKPGGFRGCLTLRTLKLRGLGLQHIAENALDDFKSLIELDLTDNQLTMPNTLAKLIKALPAIQSLQLSGNDLRNITSSYSLGPMQHLQRLEFERCQLTNVSTSLWVDNTKLKIVKLGGNNLTKLPVGLFAKQIFLEELHLDQNQFKLVPNEAMKYLYHLTLLNMSGNVLTKLTENSFDYIGSLQKLDLSANRMRSIAERAFHNVTRLRELILDDNLLSTFYMRTFRQLPELVELNVRGNLLSFIPVAVQGLRQVTSIDLSLNRRMLKLKEIPESRAVMKTVTQLRITMTNFTTITPTDFELVPALLDLDLSANKLSRVAPYAFRSLTSLTRLDLSRNQIIHLSRERFIGLESLKWLNLTRNQLVSLDVFPYDLNGLMVLDVSHNRIRALARDSLTHLTNLVRLNLRGNLLSEIRPEVLHPMPSLKALELADNSFSVLPLDGIQAIEDTLESVTFEGNPLICSCQSYVQKIWLRQHRKWMTTDKRGSKVGPQCSEPLPLLDRYLLTVKDSELCPLPSVNSLQLSIIKPYSFLLTWESPDTNMTGLKGFIVAYHRLDTNDQVKKYRLPPSIRGFRVEQILDDTLYYVCVVTRGSSWRSSNMDHSTSVSASGIKMEPLIDGINESDDDYDDIEALEALGLIRTDRDASGLEITDDVEDEDGGGNTGGGMAGDLMKSMSNWLLYGGAPDDFGYNNTDISMYPSSNDTHLMVTKPMLVNLGSKSSKCTEIKTPMDPAKMRFIDNKRMSIIIGCTAGILVFIFIIISIVMNREEKEDEEEVAEESLAEGSHKSPSSKKSNRSDSLNHTPRLNNQPRISRNNSQSSSLLNNTNRMSLVETGGAIAGPDGLPLRTTTNVRNSTSGNPTAASSASNTLKRSGTLTRNNQPPSTPLNHTQKQPGGHSSSGGGRLMSKQSSTESGPSSRPSGLSRQSSSATDGGPIPPVPGSGNRNNPYQSWHGTPRNEHPRAGGGVGGRGADLNSHTASLPRRGGGGLVDKRRSAHLSDSRGGGGDAAAIPLIEYSLVENGHGGGNGPQLPPLPPMDDLGGHYSVPNRGRGPPKMISDNPRQSYEHTNHIGGGAHNNGVGLSHHLMGNHIDSEADESLDYYPDNGGGPPRTQRPNNRGAYVKYNSFANY